MRYQPAPVRRIASRISSITTGLLLVCLYPGTVVAAQPLSVSPQQVQLAGNFERVQLVVTQADHGAVSDVTRQVKYQSRNDQVVTVSATGQLQAAGNGTTEVVVRLGSQGQAKTVVVPVQVVGFEQIPKIDFVTHIRPILNKSGCASAACHAAQHGKGGFKLSVFGFDPQADYEAIARSARQRRLSLASPELSLFLRKPTMQVPHQGGRRLAASSVEYDMLRAWVANGAPSPVAKANPVTSVQVHPNQVISHPEATQQLRVVATYADGKQRDVTALAQFDSNDPGIVEVDDGGHVSVVGNGQTVVMIRFENESAIATFVVPFSGKIDLKSWSSNNRLDELAVAKFKELNLQPSPTCDDATFVRRAFLDAIGTLPSPKQVADFMASKRADKRRRLVEQLLGLTGDPNLDIHNDQYAAYWTLKWSDLIRNNSTAVGEQGMWALHNWIKESFRTNKPFDKFVRELVTAKGSIYSNGPANFFRINTSSTALTEATAQLFLGVRLECAKCHHHPFERYSQADYYGLAAFFSRVTSKRSEEFGLFGRETVVMVRSTGEVSHPRTRKRMMPTPLMGEPTDHPLDRRLPLADWLTAKDNELFAKSIVNRYVGYLLGRGLVEPIDDMRSTNPPSNVAMLDFLAAEFVKSDFNLKQLMRVIMTSHLYQRSSTPLPTNQSDRRFFSHYRVKRLAAEPLLDAVDQATGVRTKFKSLPKGTRAIELPDAEYPNYFLKTFAKPKRASVCECERSPDENLAQALHTLNGDTLALKIADKQGRVAQALAAKKSHADIVRDLYLATLCRPPPHGS